MLGAAWAWWDRNRLDPWKRLQSRVQRALQGLGVEAGAHHAPRRLAQAVRDRFGAAGHPLAALLETLELQRYGRAALRRPSALWMQQFTASCAMSARGPLARARTIATMQFAPSLRHALLALAVLVALVVLMDAAAAGPKKKASTQSEEPPDQPAYGQRDDAMGFARALAERKELDASWVQDKLAQARYVPNVARLVMPPPAGTAKNWVAYRARFVDPLRIRTGLAFWNEHAKWLQKAEAVYGVPASIVVGIIGVETLYGQQMGNFRVIDALATLAFDFPPGRKDRSEFFRDELEQLFVLCRSEGRDPLELKGSYAGAMGMPQFMPSSWNRYAVDFDGDGHVDLHDNPADVIGSVAHYLAEFGWVRDQPAYFRVAVPVDTSDRATLLAPDIVPTFSVAEFEQRGAQLTPDALSHEGKLALVELQNGDAAPSYVAGTQNFYAITRYNWSSYYAMAVIDLGAAIARERDRQ